MRRKNKTLCIFVSFFLAAAFTLSGCGKEKVYANHNDAYTVIDTIDNFQFEVPSSLLEETTVLSEIKEDATYESSRSYIYKTEDTWQFFNMKLLVISVQKGTSFHYEGTDFEDCLYNSSINGTWFEPESKKTKVAQETKDATSKYVATVVGEVVITNTMYGDYVGRLAILEKDGEEYSIFAGVAGSSYETVAKQNKKVLQQIVNSANICEKEIPEEGFRVNSNTNQETELEAETKPVDISSDEPASDEQIVVNPEPESDLTDPDIDASLQGNEEVSIVEEESDTSNVSEEETDDIEVVVVEDNEETSTSDEQADKQVEEPDGEMPPDNEEVSEITEEIPTPITYDNPTQQNIETGLTFDSSKWAETTALGDKNADVTVYVKVRGIYSGSEAKRILEGAGVIEKAPDGCAWEVVEYECSDNPKTAYVNIVLQGVDRKNLKFRGVKYSPRTYDIFSYAEEIDGAVRKLYAYYAVPNGCGNYSLGFGSSATGRKYYKK